MQHDSVKVPTRILKRNAYVVQKCTDNAGPTIGGRISVYQEVIQHPKLKIIYLGPPCQSPR
jgi:hypothetical protein